MSVQDELICDVRTNSPDPIEQKLELRGKDSVGVRQHVDAFVDLEQLSLRGLLLAFDRGVFIAYFLS